MKEWYKVKVFFKGFVHYDEIKGVSREDALKNAKWNWEDALSIEVLEKSI